MDVVVWCFSFLKVLLSPKLNSFFGINLAWNWWSHPAGLYIVKNWLFKFLFEGLQTDTFTLIFSAIHFVSSQYVLNLCISVYFWNLAWPEKTFPSILCWTKRWQKSFGKCPFDNCVVSPSWKTSCKCVKPDQLWVLLNSSRYDKRALLLDKPQSWRLELP